MPSNTSCGVELAGSLEVAPAAFKQNATIKTIVGKVDRNGANRILIIKDGSILPCKSAACRAPESPVLLLDSLQENRRSDEGDDRPEQHHKKSNSVKRAPRLIQSDQAKSATKMRERDNISCALSKEPRTSE